MRNEISAGGIVFRGGGAGTEILLMRDRFGKWTLPKGHQDPGETIEGTALREIEEETGISGRVIDYIGQIEYKFMSGNEEVRKTVHFFLVEALSSDIQLNYFEAKDARWVVLDDLENEVGYPDMSALLNKGAAKLRQVR